MIGHILNSHRVWPSCETLVCEDIGLAISVPTKLAHGGEIHLY